MQSLYGTHNSHYIPTPSNEVEAPFLNTPYSSMTEFEAAGASKPFGQSALHPAGPFSARRHARNAAAENYETDPVSVEARERRSISVEGLLLLSPSELERACEGS